jgi:hypothetical protein
MLIPYILLICFALLALYSYFRIRRGNKLAEFMYQWGFIIGSFVWEDSFVFSVLGTLASAITIYLGELKYGALFFILFWLVRSAGETLYMFLEQFIEPKHYPHNFDTYLGPMHFLFGKISNQQCFIIMQVMFQSITVISLFSLIFLIQNWNLF